MPDKNYCTGNLYRKSIGGYIYWSLSHAGVDYCPLHDDLTRVERIKETEQIQAIRAAIDACPDTESSASGDYHDDIRPTLSTTIKVIYGFGILLMGLKGWILPLIGCLLIIYSARSIGLFWYSVNGPAETVEKILIERQYKIEKQKEAKQRWRVWLAANYSIKRALSYHLTRIGFAHIMSQSGGAFTPDKKISSPRMSKPFIADDSITYKVLRMPFRSYLSDLLEPRTTTELSLSLGREVVAHERNDGVYLEVMLKTGVAGIKNKFAWDSRETELNALGMLPMTPPKLVIPFGLSRGRRFHYGDLTSSTINHMIVAGSTGGGKSNFINQLLCTWVKHTDYRYLNLYLVDLKRVELLDYAKLLHLKRPIVVDPQDVFPLLDEIYKEIKRRAEVMEGQARNIKQWNGGVHTGKISGNRLPYIALVIDELAECASIDGWRNQGEKKLIQIIQLGRAMGVHVILATQIVKSSIIGTLATANIPCRVCFPVGSINGSMLIVETKAAYELPRIPGRAVYVSGADRTEVQTPEITSEQIEKTIADAVTRDEEIRDSYNSTDNPAVLVAMAMSTITRSITGEQVANQLNVSRGVARYFIQRNQFNYEKQRPVIEHEGKRWILITNGRGAARTVHRVNGTLPATYEEVKDVEIDPYLE